MNSVAAVVLNPVTFSITLEMQVVKSVPRYAKDMKFVQTNMGKNKGAVVSNLYPVVCLAF